MSFENTSDHVQTIEKARKKYHQTYFPNEMTIESLQFDQPRTPFHLYLKQPQPNFFPDQNGNKGTTMAWGSTQARINTKALTYNAPYPGALDVGLVIVPFHVSRIAIPPMGLGGGWSEYLKNIREQLQDKIYLLSPMYFYQSLNQRDKHGELLVNLTGLPIPANTSARKIFGKTMMVGSRGRLNPKGSPDTLTGYLTDTKSYDTITKGMDYLSIKNTNLRHLVASKTKTIETNVGVKNNFMGLSSKNISELSMGYAQSYIYFTDLRPPEILLRQDSGQHVPEGPTYVISSGPQYGMNVSQMVGGTYEMGSEYLKQKIDEGVYVEKWYNRCEEITGSLAHYDIPSNRYMMIYPKRFDATRRETRYHQNKDYYEDDIYSSVYSISTSDSLISIVIDDQYITKVHPNKNSTWLSLPQQTDTELISINHARYRHLSLFHINGNNNRIILKIGTEKLPAKFVHGHTDKDYLNLFSFAPNTKDNVVFIAYTQEDIDKRVACTENYFRLNDPPGGYTDSNRDRYAVYRTYTSTTQKPPPPIRPVPEPTPSKPTVSWEDSSDDYNKRGDVNMTTGKQVDVAMGGTIVGTTEGSKPTPKPEIPSAPAPEAPKKQPWESLQNGQYLGADGKIYTFSNVEDAPLNLKLTDKNGAVWIATKKWRGGFRRKYQYYFERVG